MRQQQLFAIAACLCSAAVVLVSAVPVPADNQELDVLQIPLSDDKELDVLTLGAKGQEQIIADRNKRTIGLLRELFPDITKQIDDIVNRIIGQVIRVAGPSLLPALLGNNRPTTERSDFDADFDDDDDSSNDVNSQEKNSVFSKSDAATSAPSDSSDTGGTRVSIVLPTFAPANESSSDAANKNGATDTQIDLSAINKQLEETIRVARQVKEAEAAAQAIAQQQQQQQTTSSIPAQLPIPSKTDPNAPIQLSFNNEVTPLSSTPDSSKPVNNDLRLTESKSPAIDELTLDSNEDAADLDDRNKRFLSFGGGGVAAGSSGNTGNAAAGGGSGNFLFDIIRLFSGSVQTQTGDEAANGANSVGGGGDTDGDSDANRAADGFTEGIPGPVTRLVVLANRGLANLIQDLILRIAATSEKFVNFKAKLITALI